MAALAGSVLPVYPHACGRMGLGGVGAWSREHGIKARMGSVLLHLCRPSVKMLRCCDGAAGANGRRTGAGCDNGAGRSGGNAVVSVPGVIPNAVGCLLGCLQDGGVDRDPVHSR